MAAVALAAAGVALALIFGGRKTPESASAEEGVPGAPSVEIISPRNGARQTSHAAVVKVKVENFQLAPRQLGGEPQLGEGHLRFSLKRVPDCVYPKKLLDAINSPVGKGRLTGRSFDYAGYAGPNGVLAEEIGSSGSYSPATRPEIYYHGLPPGLYRLIVNLAQNSGMPTQFHDVTNFQILPRHNKGPKPCPPGKVSSTKAAQRLE
ncbi:MAG TPA: hypothetical protein VNR67_09160 [Solirubrobacterales bacterium]|nr:hypothetical protein [Solirubrobacterales bacterium]